MKKKERNHAYALWMLLLTVMLLFGVALLILSIRQGPFFSLDSASI